jgi:hypothetical protein
MDNSDILDKAILANVSEDWTKVAMVVVQAADDLGDDADFDELGQRVVALANSGALESQGDLSNWRFSEVRRPSKR